MLGKHVTRSLGVLLAVLGLVAVNAAPLRALDYSTAHGVQRQFIVCLRWPTATPTEQVTVQLCGEDWNENPEGDRYNTFHVSASRTVTTCVAPGNCTTTSKSYGGYSTPGRDWPTEPQPAVNGAFFVDPATWTAVWSNVTIPSWNGGTCTINATARPSDGLQFSPYADSDAALNDPYPVSSVVSLWATKAERPAQGSGSVCGWAESEQSSSSGTISGFAGAGLATYVWDLGM